MKKRDTLTKGQERVYSFLQKYIGKNGESPTLSKIKGELGAKSLRSVTQYLEVLERKGLIERDRYAPRGVKLLPDRSTGENLIQVPVFASAGCGNPSIIAQRTFDEFVSVSADVIKHKRNVFVIKASGDSMRDAGIQDGDFVLAEMTMDVRSGDIVVAIIDDNAVIKKLSLSNNVAVLSPVTDDSRYSPIIVRRDFMVFGKVLDVIKVERNEDYEIVPIEHE